MSKPNSVYDYQLGEYNLELRMDLGLTRDLKKVFNKDYTKIYETIGDMTVEEYVKFIYTSIYQPEMQYKEFSDSVMESGVGFLDLIECITTINLNIQMPGKTPDEQKQMMARKIKERREMDDMSKA